MLIFLMMLAFVAFMFSLVGSSFTGNIVNPGELYNSDRNKIVGNMYANKAMRMQDLKANGLELKDMSAQGIYNFENNSGISWDSLRNNEQQQYENLSKQLTGGNE